MIDLHAIRAVISDIDGVLWRGETPLPGVAEFFGALRQRQIPFVLATNNATATFPQIARRLKALGLDLRKEETLTSANAAASFLRHQLPAGTAVLAVGEEGLTTALSQAGFRLVQHAAGAQAVVAGLDRHVTWQKLTEAALAIQAGAMFVATNQDPTFPSERGLVPGAGALIAALETATGCRPLLDRQARAAALPRGPRNSAGAGTRLRSSWAIGSRRISSAASAPACPRGLC